MIRALESLYALGALGEDACLTRYWGNYMAEFPLEPSLSKALLVSWKYGCVLEVATIIAMLQVKQIWASGDRRAVDKAKLRFSVAEGDLITYLNVWKAWEENGRRKNWAIDNYVNHRCLLRASDIRDRLMKQIISIKRHATQDDPVVGGGHTSDLKKNLFWGGYTSHEETEQVVKKIRRAFTAGLFMNAVQLRYDRIGAQEYDASGNVVYRLVRNQDDPTTQKATFRIHPSSVMFRCQPQYMCFYSAQQAQEDVIDMQEVHIIEPEWLSEEAPQYFVGRKRQAF